MSPSSKARRRCDLENLTLSTELPQVLNKSQSSQLKGLEALHNAEANEVMKRLEQESKVGESFYFFVTTVIFIIFNRVKSDTSTE